MDIYKKLSLKKKNFIPPFLENTFTNTSTEISQTVFFWRTLWSIKLLTLTSMMYLTVSFHHVGLNKNPPFCKFFFELTKIFKSLFSYREVAHTHWILQEAFKAGSPAGHTLLRDSPVGSDTREASVAVQAALAAASLQLHTAVVYTAHAEHTR